MKVIDSEVLNSAELQPLQQLAAVRMAISICRTEDVQCLIRNFSKINGNSAVGYSDDQWKQLCGMVRNKLEQISVPKLIIEIILKKMWPISFEIFKWILCHDADMDIDSSSKFYWTPFSNIDYKKTAEMLIENETIDIEKRFKLACFYCLEVKVRSLYEMMSLPERRFFFERGNLKKPDLNPIVLYWTYYIQEVPIDFWESKTFNLTQLFKYAVKNGYLYATKFFLGKIETRLRNRMISNCFNVHLIRFFRLRIPGCIAKSSHFVTAYFLINEYNVAFRGLQGQGHLFMINLVFRYFLEWPLQKHFVTVVDRLKHYVDDARYGILLEAIFDKEMGGFKDYDYKKLFMEFWRQSPNEYKTYVNKRTKFGSDIFFRFVKKHFIFVFYENSFTLKWKLRATILQRDISKVPYFDLENVDFFKFLVRERVTTKASVGRISNEDSMYSFDEEYESLPKILPLGELMYLVDTVLRTQ